MPVTVKIAGAASPAYCGLFVTTLLPHVRLTRTPARLPSLNTLLTVKVALLSVLVIVQEGVPPTVMETLAQPAWLAV
jgi:hypothetical protein